METGPRDPVEFDPLLDDFWQAEREEPPVELWSAVGDVPPWATMLLILSWALVFSLLAFRGQVGDAAVFILWGASVTHAPAADAAWRLLASTFLHAGPLHLLLNAASMLIFGPAVERIYTRRGFAVVFALGGALASLASLLWRTSHHGAGLSLSVGASGAIFALAGALLTAAARLRRRLAPGRSRALGGAVLFLVAQGLASGFTQYGTDNTAHGAGLVAGLLIGTLLPLNPRLGGPGPGRASRAVGVLAALGLVGSLALALWRGLHG